MDLPGRRLGHRQQRSPADLRRSNRPHRPLHADFEGRYPRLLDPGPALQAGRLPEPDDAVRPRLRPRRHERRGLRGVLRPAALADGLQRARAVGAGLPVLARRPRRRESVTPPNGVAAVERAPSGPLTWVASADHKVTAVRTAGVALIF